MSNPLKIHREEWPLALSVVLWVTVLQALMLLKHYDVLFGCDAQSVCDTPLQSLISRYFNLSGFDAITYRVLTDWGFHFDVVRHPLLPFLLYPLYLTNQFLWWLTGVNCAMPLTCALLTVCAVYSSVLFYRIERRVVGIARCDAMLLSVLFCSFAYIMATFIAPDHFALSLVLLLWLFGDVGTTAQQNWWRGAWQTLLLGGVTLTNGAKALVVGAGRAFQVKRGHVKRTHTRHYLLAYLLPFCLVVGTAWVQHRLVVLPRVQAQEQYEKEHRAEIMQEARENHKKYRFAPWVIHKGQPLDYGDPKDGNELAHSLLRWTDVTTPRWESAVENLLGESIQFHERHMLEDVLVYYRPVLLGYDGWWHYAVEALLVALFLAGCWVGRRKRLLWLLLACAAIDWTMHIALGFAINEVYIMSAHWLFTLPLVMGFLFLPNRPTRQLWTMRAVVSLLALYLFIYNGWKLIGWLLQPIQLPPFLF